MKIEIKDNQAFVYELRDTPKTGDDSNPMLWMALMGASLLGIAACGAVYLKSKKKEDIE